MSEVKIDADVLECAWQALHPDATHYTCINRSNLEEAIVEAIKRWKVDPSAAIAASKDDAQYRRGLDDGYMRATKDAAMLSDRVTDSRSYLKDAIDQLKQAGELLARLDATVDLRHAPDTDLATTTTMRDVAGLVKEFEIQYYANAMFRDDRFACGVMHAVRDFKGLIPEVSE